MINRCQSELILNNRCIETRCKRVDKYLDKCKFLLRSIQKEFQKTKDFAEQLKRDHNTIENKSIWTRCGEQFDSKNEDPTSKTSINIQNDSFKFTKISKLDVKHLEAFLDIVQKTQLSRCGSEDNTEANQVVNSKEEFDVFEDALCELRDTSSTSSLVLDQSSSILDEDSFERATLPSDIEDTIPKQGLEIEGNVAENSCLLSKLLDTSYEYSQHGNEKERNEISRSIATHQNHTSNISKHNIINHFEEYCKKFHTKDVVIESQQDIVPNAVESGKIDVKNSVSCSCVRDTNIQGDSDSDEYVEACDYFECGQEGPVELNQNSLTNAPIAPPYGQMRENIEYIDAPGNKQNEKLSNFDSFVDSNRMLIDPIGMCRDVSGRSLDRSVKFSQKNKILNPNDWCLAKHVERLPVAVKRDNDHFNYNENLSKGCEKELVEEKRSRVRNRASIRQRRERVTERKDERVKTRSRSRSGVKCFNDVATGTSDLETYEYSYPWAQRLQKNIDAFSSIRKKNFNHLPQEYAGIFYPQAPEPYHFNNQDYYERYHGQSEFIVTKHMPLNTFARPTISNSKLSDRDSNTTFCLENSSSSSDCREVIPAMKNEYANDDHFSIHNSTIMNKSNTNIYVFRSVEDLKLSDLDEEICYESGAMKKNVEKNRSESDSTTKSPLSDGERKKTRRDIQQRKKIKRFTTESKSRQVDLHSEELDSEELSNKCISDNVPNCISTRLLKKEGSRTSRITLQAVIPSIGYVLGEHMEICLGSKLINETKILYHQTEFAHSPKNNNIISEVVKDSNCKMRKVTRSPSVNESKTVKTINNSAPSPYAEAELGSDIKKRSFIIRKSSLSSESRTINKSPNRSSQTSFKEDCCSKQIEGKENNHVFKLDRKSSQSSVRSVNRKCTVFNSDKNSNRTEPEANMLSKDATKSSDVVSAQIDPNEELITSVNLIKSSSSFQGTHLNFPEKVPNNRRTSHSKLMTGSDSALHDKLFSKINVFPLEGMGRGFIQQVCIVGQHLSIEGAVNEKKDSISSKKGMNSRSFTLSNKPRDVKLSSFNDNGPKNQSKGNISKRNLQKSEMKISNGTRTKKTIDGLEPKPRFSPYVNRNFMAKQNQDFKPLYCKHRSHIERMSERRIQTPPYQARKQKTNDSFGSYLVYDKDQFEDNEKTIEIFTTSKESFDSVNTAPNTDDSCDLSVSNFNVNVKKSIVDSPMNRDQTNKQTHNHENDSRVNLESKNHLNSKGAGKDFQLDKSKCKSLNVKFDENVMKHDSRTCVNKTLVNKVSDVSLLKRKSQLNSIGFEHYRQSSNKSSKENSPSHKSCEKDNVECEERRRIRQKLSCILPNNCPIKQIMLKNLNQEKNNADRDDLDYNEVDVFGAPLVNNLGVPFYNEFGYPNTSMSGNSLYSTSGIPTRGAYGKPIHANLRKELSQIVENSEKRRNVFHRINRDFEEQLLHALQKISDVKMDLYGRVYDSYGRPLFDRYGYFLYDQKGNPLTDAFGRRLTDRYGVSLIVPNKKCANVMLPTHHSSNESLTSHHSKSSDEKPNKNESESTESKKASAWKKCKRQVSFNMDPHIITVNDSDSEAQPKSCKFLK